MMPKNRYALSSVKMPTQAIANGLRLPSIPPELSCVNPLEVRLTFYENGGLTIWLTEMFPWTCSECTI